MSSFFWNVRGLNKSSKHSVVKKWLEGQKFQFGCLLETRIKESKMSWVSSTLFSNWSLLTNYEYNSRGRIWVLWRDSVRLTPFYKSGQMITCAAKLAESDEEFFCSFVYASNFPEERKVLWGELRDHFDSPIISSKPWLIYGDFNEILDMAEHSRAEVNPVIPSGMRDFQSVVNYCSFTDQTSHGPVYTWCNKRENDLILKKLDRVLVNEKWTQTFPQSYNVFEAGGCSDHLRCRISIIATDATLLRKRKPFKFVNVIADMVEFKPMVDNFWRETEPIFLSTSSLFRFSKKLKLLKPKIRNLAKDTMGNLVVKAREAFEQLCQKQ